MPSATAAGEAPAANRTFFAVTKKTARRTAAGSDPQIHWAEVETCGRRAHEDTSTRPHTSAGRRAASASATAPPSEWPIAIAGHAPSASMSAALTSA